MAAASQRKKRRQSGSGGGLPGWAMLTIGLIIGLFVAFLVYLDDIDPGGTEQATRPDTEAVETEAEDRPRFEFYSILPELEVVIPEFPGRRGEAEAEEGTTPPPEGLDPIPETEPDGQYFLQVGSFREPDQADRMKAEVALLGLDVRVVTVEVNDEQWHRVRAGPFGDVGALDEARERLQANDIEYLVLRERSSG